YPALEEKSRILHEIGNTLRNIDIKSKKYLISKAPLADESFGQREIAKGEIPSGGTVPLNKIVDHTQIIPVNYTKPINFPKDSIPLPVPGKLLQSDEIDSLAQRFDKFPRASLEEFRAWTAKVLPEPNFLRALNAQDAESMLTSLTNIAQKLEMAKLDDKEVALALIETAAIADHLLKNANDIPAGAHLPIHQMIKQLQTSGSVNIDSFHPQMLNQADEISKDPAKLLFNEALLQRKATLTPKSQSKNYEYAWIHGAGGIPWETIKLMTIKVKSLLPLQVKHAVPEWETLSLGEILNAFYDYQYTGPLKAVRELAEIQARFSAKILTSNVMKFAEELASHFPAEPQMVIDAIHRWSRTFNPSTIDRTTLELLSQKQRIALIDSFGQITQSFVSANFQIGTLLPAPETMLRFIELLTMTDKIMAYSTDREMTRFQVPMNDFLTIIKGNNPFFRTYDPLYETTTLQSIKNWLLERERFQLNEGSELYNPLFTEFPGFFNPAMPHDYYNYHTLYTIHLASLLTADHEDGHRLDDFRGSVNRGGMGANINNEDAIIAFEAYADANFVSPKTGEKMPSWFNSIKVMTHFSYHTLYRGFIKHNGDIYPDTFKPDYSLDRKYYDWSNYKITEVHSSLNGILAENFALHPEIPDGLTKGHLFSHLELPITDQGINKKLRDIHLNSIVTNPQISWAIGNIHAGINFLPREIYDLNVAMTKETESDRSIYSSDNYRKKWSMRGVAPLQAFLTISTYLEHPEWLTHIDEQIEFLNLLFDPGLLWNHLQEGGGVGPQAEADLSKFLHTQYLVHNKNPELQAYFAEVGIRLNQYSAAARESAPDIYINIPVPEELEALANLPKKMLARKGLPTEERSIYGALYAISYIDKPALDSKEMIEFLQGMFAYRSNDPLRMVNILHIDRQIDSLLERIQPELMEALYPKGQFDQNILKQILSDTVDTNKIILIPSSSHPLIFSDAENTMSINLQEGTYIQVGKEGLSIPMEARFSSAFKAVHGTTNYRSKVIDRFTFQFIDNQGYTNLIQKNSKTNDWNLYRQFEDSTTPFQSVTASWMQGKPWLKSKAMLNQYTHWHRQGVSSFFGENVKPEVRLLDREGKLAFKVELTGKDGHEIKRIIKANSSVGELVLADIDQDAYAWARQFEDAGFIHAWISSETGMGQQIEFLRAGNEGLQFSWKNNHWQLDSTPQYHVAKRQINPLFAQQTNYLLLETEKGEQRLLIPRQKPKIDMDYNLANIPFDRQPTVLIAQRMLTLEKNSKTGKFESSDVETNLYLAMLQLGHRNYRDAHSLLNVLAHSEKGRFNDAEMEILDWIIESSSLPLDETPQSIAIRTFAALVKSRNIEKNPLNNGKDHYEIPPPLKKDYLKHIQGLSELRMPPDDEARLFLNGILSGDMPVMETIAELQISDPENARKAVDVAIQQKNYNKTIDLGSFVTPSDSSSIALNSPRPDIISSELFNELIRVEKKTTGLQDLSAQTSAIFDYESDWYKKLSGPTQEFFKSVESGVHQFQKTRDSDSYHLLDADKFNALLKTMEIDQRELSMEMVRLRFKILDLANSPPSDVREAQLLKLQRESGIAKPVTFEMLIDAFIKNDLRHYRSLNPNMSIEQATELDQALQTFVDIVPEWEFRQRLNQSMQTVIEAKENPERLQGALKGFVKAKNSIRLFPHEAKRLMKVMEYQTGTYYHKGQVDSLGTLGLPGLETSATSNSDRISGVHRITVGAGKTSRLLPSLLQYYAEEGKLALAIMPEAQLTSAGREFSHIMQEVYIKPTLELQFTLKDANTENLEAILKKMKTAITQGSPVLTSGKSLRVLRNLFVNNNVELIKG
ncbi:MAG TPA: hypothetical protein VGP47_02720, partial [Parachlamydiaceae bacterium]|nr:hypothetical protein [Parachlamydiaceae bacterium]